MTMEIKGHVTDFRKSVHVPDFPVPDFPPRFPPGYVRVPRFQDLIIMTSDIRDLWKELERFYSDTD